MVAIGLAVGSGRCQNTCSIFWGIEPSFANLVPNFSPDAEKTGLDGVGCASKCTDYTWCSSFFIQTSGRCLMFKTVFITKEKMVSSPGTVYNRIYSDDCPVEEYYSKSREHNLCLFFFGLGPDSVRLNYQESVDKCSAINGHLPILDTKSKMEWVKGVFRSNIENFSSIWTFYLDGKRRTASSFVWGDGQPIPLDRRSGGLWASNSPVALPDFSCMAAVIKALGIDSTIQWVDLQGHVANRAVVCQHRALNNRTGWKSSFFSMFQWHMIYTYIRSGPNLFILYSAPLFSLITTHSLSNQSFGDDTLLLHSSFPDQIPLSWLCRHAMMHLWGDDLNEWPKTKWNWKTSLRVRHS